MTTPEDLLNNGPISEEIDDTEVDDIDALGEEQDVDEVGTVVEGMDTPAYDPTGGDEEEGEEEGEEEPPAEAPPAEGQEQPSYPPIDPEQAYRIAQENAQLRQRQTAESVNTEAQRLYQQYTRHLIDNDGMDPQHAARVAYSEVGSALQSAVQGHQQKTQQTQRLSQMEMQAKAYMAKEIGDRLGVEPKALMIYSTPQQMFEAAKGQANLSRARRRNVPAQNYDQKGGAKGGSSITQLVDKYNAGARLTPQQEAQVERWLGH